MYLTYRAQMILDDDTLYSEETESDATLRMTQHL